MNEICQHFGLCGGCSLQDIPYIDQIKQKEEYLEKMFDREIKVVPSPNQLRYRNKMDYSASRGKIGQREKGDHKSIIDLNQCLLLSERNELLFGKIKELIKKYNIQDYNTLTNKGYLRYVVMREAINNKQNMVVFVTKTEDEAILAVINEIINNCDSIVWSINESDSDLSYGRIFKTFNSNCIIETFTSGTNIIKYKFGANSFFQNNSGTAELLYSRIKEFTEGKVLDLYCGVGSITLFVADNCEKIIGVEIVPEAIDYAKENMNINKINNTEFYCADTRDIFDFEIIEQDFDVIILDPPRGGMGNKIIRKVIKKKPKRIIYVSCNPKKLKEELHFFLGYEIAHIEAFDMFPQTNHEEVLCVLDRVI